MAKIAVAGWHHETNTFSTIKADLPSFERADEWPPMAYSDEMLDAVQGVHLPINGAVDYLRQQNHAIVPLLWCSAMPCAHVTEHAFETIMGHLLKQLDAVLPIDGLYLDLHGAMVCEHLQDGEGEILSRIRQLVGDQLPISVSLDLHANVTPKMVEHASVIDIFRTYPHIDMGETGKRAAQHLEQLIKCDRLLFKAFRQTDFIIPLNWGCTAIEPAQSLYHYLSSLTNERVPCVGFACGFHLSDIYDVGPSVLAYSYTQEEANATADKLLERIHDCESQFGGKIWASNEGVTHAMELAREATGPIILADTQDNPGGGGPGDTTGLLQSLLNLGAQDTLLGVISDPATAAKAHELGVGQRFDTLLGEQAGLPDHHPFATTVLILQLSNGSFTAKGPMYKGARIEIGRCALLQIEAVTVLVSSNAVQVADQEIFKHIGVDPSQKSIVALKSSVHFRNDFTKMASEILIVASPGPVYADSSSLRFENIRPNIRLTPNTKN